MSDDMVFLNRPPLLYSAMKFMMRHRMRGAWRLFELMKRRNYFQRKVISYEIEWGVRIHVPIYRPERRWDRFDLLHYEPELIKVLVDLANRGDAPLTIIDCGADLGLISILLSVRIARVSRVIAIEPSDDEITLLRKNLSSLSVPAEVIHAGLSDFNGRGQLRSPEYDSYHQARFVEPVAEGGFDVMTLDSLGLQGQDLLIKIDVEGGELAVIRGARKTLATATGLIVAIEAHPLVARRTGIDPIVVLRELASIRSFHFTVCENPEANLDLSRPFFDQMPRDLYNCNVVAVAVHEE